MDKEIIKNALEALGALPGWKVEAKIDSQTQNGETIYPVGLFFTKDGKRKFAGRTVDSLEEAEEMLESFEEAVKQFKGGKRSPGKKKEVEEVDEEEESEEEGIEIEDDDEEEVEDEEEDQDDDDGKRCGCGPHDKREEVSGFSGDRHLICQHGFCLCGWSDDGVRHLGKMFGVEVFAKTKDKDKLEKIKKFLKGK